MRFTVGNTVTDNSNNGDVPVQLNNVNFPPTKSTVDHVFNFQHGGDDLWTINGVDFNDVNNRVLARPQQGAVELWELNYASGPGIHPAHIHLVNFQILSRTGGNRPVFPYESAGLKDTVLLAPGESVQVNAIYGPWNGMYMFHCHNLIHEDSLMMDVFNVTLLDELGYKFKDTQEFWDPMDPRFRPRPSAASDYEESSIRSTLSALGNLNAYKHAAKVAAAESEFYATAGYPTESGGPAPPTSSPLAASGQPTGSEGPAPATSSPVAISGNPKGSEYPASATSTPVKASGTPSGYGGPTFTGSHEGRPSGGPPGKERRWAA